MQQGPREGPSQPLRSTTRRPHPPKWPGRCHRVAVPPQKTKQHPICHTLDSAAHLSTRMPLLDLAGMGAGGATASRGDGTPTTKKYPSTAKNQAQGCGAGIHRVQPMVAGVQSAWGQWSAKGAACDEQDSGGACGAALPGWLAAGTANCRREQAGRQAPAPTELHKQLNRASEAAAKRLFTSPPEPRSRRCEAPLSGARRSAAQ